MPPLNGLTLILVPVVISLGFYIGQRKRTSSEPDETITGMGEVPRQVTEERMFNPLWPSR